MRLFVHSFTVCISALAIFGACDDSGAKARGGQGGAGGHDSGLTSSGGRGGNPADGGSGGATGSGGSTGTVLSDAGTNHDTGTYSQGPYTCCGEGQGLACCTKDKGLLGFDVSPDGTVITPVGDTSLPMANCFTYGGTYGGCTPQGQQLEAKVICAVCCAGLTRNPALEPGDNGKCVATDGAPVSVAVCLPCGNGVCDKDENRCNCPSDCK